MRPPSFWNKTHGREAAIFLRTLLTPFSVLYNYFTQKRIRQTIPFELNVPVISIGNITLGGTGKTPFAKLLAQNIDGAAIVSRGYGGTIKLPTIVDTKTHNATQTGDEPLMLSKDAMVVIGRDRVAAAKLAVDNNAKAIIMDDGHQNPSLKKDLSIILIDGGVGFGNNHIFPAGPLREKPYDGLKRADIIIWIGDKKLFDETITDFHGKIFFANIAANKPDLNDAPDSIVNYDSGADYIAFCGIGRPEKFHDSLKAIGINVIDLIPFPDHHFYSDNEIKELKSMAQSRSAKLITTEKDMVKLDNEMRMDIETLPIEIIFEGKDDLQQIIDAIKK